MKLNKNKPLPTPNLMDPDKLYEAEIIQEKELFHSFQLFENLFAPIISSNRQKFIFKINSKFYMIILDVIETNIKLTVLTDFNISTKINVGGEQMVFCYAKKFSLDDLKKINKIFKLCDNSTDIIEVFEKIFIDEENKPMMSEDKEKFIIMKKIQLSSNSLQKNLSNYIKFELPKLFKKFTYINKNCINDLCNRYNKMNISINNTNANSFDFKNDLENRIENLEQKNNELINIIKETQTKKQKRMDSLERDICLIDELLDNISEHNSVKCGESPKKLLGKKKLSSFSTCSDISNLQIKKNNSKTIINQINEINEEENNECFNLLSELKQENNNEQNDTNKSSKNKHNISENLSIITKNYEEESTSNYLYGEENSSMEINEDISLFNNKHSNIIINNTNTVTNIINNNINNVNNVNSSNNSNNTNTTNNIINKNEIKEKLPSKKDININLNNNHNKKNCNNDINDSKNNIIDSYNMIGCTIKQNQKINNNQKNFINNNDLINIDSKILFSNSELDFVLNYITNFLGKKIIRSLKIYRATEDGDQAEIFHNQCDGSSPVLILISTTNGKKFGGFSSIGFNSKNISLIDDFAFIFNINKKKIFHVKKNCYAIDCFANMGPCFSGNNIKIPNGFFGKTCSVSVKENNFETKENFELNDGEKFFCVSELEVFEFLEMK